MFVSINQMASVYESFLKRICPIGPYRIGGWSFGGAVALLMSTSLKEECEMLYLFDPIVPNEENPRYAHHTEEDEIVRQNMEEMEILRKQAK